MSLITKEQLKTTAKLFKELLSLKADKSALSDKQNKIVGEKGQIVSFDKNDNVIAQEVGNILPEGTPWIEKGNVAEILPTCTIPIESSDGLGLITTPISLISGKAYAVNYNGQTYERAARRFTKDGISALCIGNLAALGEDDTGEPFLIIQLPDGVEATEGIYGQLISFDGSEEVTLSITGYAIIYHKLPKSLMPNGIESTHFVKASADGAMRHVNSMPEDENYTVGVDAFAEGYNTKASGESSHAEGASAEASGDFSHAEGVSTTASGERGSHSEGDGTTASGRSSHAEGYGTSASGYYSHAEGDHTEASNWGSHAEGYKTTASGQSSHAEGDNTSASGHQSHSEGDNTEAFGNSSHAEGMGTTASSKSQHAQGEYNIIDGTRSQATRGTYAHIVGNGTDKKRSNAHTLDWSGNAWFAGDVYVGSTSGTNKDTGSKILATQEYVTQQISTIPTPDVSGQISAATTALKNELLNGAGEAYDTLKELGDLIDNNTDALDALEIVASGKQDKITGTAGQVVGFDADGNAVAQEAPKSGAGKDVAGKKYSITIPGNSSAEIVTASPGAEIFNNYSSNKAVGSNSHAEGNETVAIGNASHAEGYYTTASEYAAHAEGQGAIASGSGSHAEGNNTTASGHSAHAEGNNTKASGKDSHAEGSWTEASGMRSHAEGQDTKASGDYSHAEGNGAESIGDYSHAEGAWAKAEGNYSHAEGSGTNVTGNYSHGEGLNVIVSGNYSHGEGVVTTTSGDYQHVQGKFNIDDTTSAHIVGNGESTTTRSNAHTLDWSGNAWFAGDVYVGSTSGTNKDDGSKKLVTVDEMNAAIAAAIEAALASVRNAEEVSF